MDERFAIPRTLDDPPLFFLWNFDEAAVVILWGMLCGLLSGKLFIPGIVIGVLCARQFARVKTEGGRGLLVRALYWYTPSDWWFPTVTPSHVREYLGG
jgi:conjugal transfer pilus assembly protein TraL